MSPRGISRFCDFVVSRFSIARSPEYPITRLSALLLLVACNSGAFGDGSLLQIVKRVDARYNHLSTLKANFQENYTGAGLTRNESGELWLEKPGKMRWDYKKPEPKVFVSDGHRVYLHVPADNQVIISPVPQEDQATTAVLFLVGPLVVALSVGWVAIVDRKGKRGVLGSLALAAIPTLGLAACLLLTQSRSAYLGLAVGPHQDDSSAQRRSDCRLSSCGNDDPWTDQDD